MGETDDDVRRKVGATLDAGLTLLLCVGEKTRTASAEHFNFVREQLRAGLASAEKRISKVVIAYEPIWAIGATEAMRPHDMHEMSIFIRKSVVEKFGEAGHSITILYGGSVDGKNAGDMMRNGDVKGLLVGRSSVDTEVFAELLRAVNAA